MIKKCLKLKELEIEKNKLINLFMKYWVWKNLWWFLISALYVNMFMLNKCEKKLLNRWSRVLMKRQVCKKLWWNFSIFDERVIGWMWREIGELVVYISLMEVTFHQKRIPRKLIIIMFSALHIHGPQFFSEREKCLNYFLNALVPP